MGDERRKRSGWRMELRRHLDDLLAGSGACLIAAGLALWSVAAALIWSGACLIVVAWALTRKV